MTKKKSSQAETSKDAAKRPKNSNRKVNKSSKVSKSNASIVKNISRDDKYKKILGLKEPIVVLKDCLKDGSLLHNLWLHNLSLEMKIECDKPKNKSKKEGVNRKNSVKLNETSKAKESKSNKKNKSKNVSRSKSKEIKNIENTDTIETANNDLNTAKPDCTLKADQNKISPDKKKNPEILVTESKSNSSSAKAKHAKKTIEDKVLNVDKCLKISLQKIPQPNTNSSAMKNTNKAKIAPRKSLGVNAVEEEDINLSPHGKMMYAKYFLPTKTSTPKENPSNLKAHSAVVFAGKQENLQRETLNFSSEDLLKKQDKNGKDKAEPGSEGQDTNSDKCTAFENTDKTLIKHSVTLEKDAKWELAIKGGSKNSATLLPPQIAEKRSRKTKSLLKQKRKSTSKSMNDDTVIKTRILSVKPYPQDRLVEGKEVQNNLDPAKSNAVVGNTEEAGVACRQLENGKNGVPKQSQNENKRGANNIVKTGNSTKGDMIDDGDSDCISLFADSALIEEYNDDKRYPMTDDVIDNYYKNTSSEFNKMYTNAVNSNEDSGSKKVAILIRAKESALVPSGTSDRVTIPQKRAAQWEFKNPDDPLDIFRGFCYKALRTGTCANLQCNYKHQFLKTMIQWCNDNEEYFFRVLDALAFWNHVTFLQNMYMLLLNHFCESDMGCVLRILKRLYELEIVNDMLVYYTVKLMRGCQHSIKSIVNQLIIIVNDSDFKFVNCMLKVIMNYITNGEYWSTLKELMLRIEYFEPKIVEDILKECLNTRMHVRDVNACIMRKLYNQTRSEINNNVISSFEMLVKSEAKEENGKGIVVENIQSPSTNSAMNTSPVDLENEYFSILSTRNAAWEVNKKGDDNNNVRDGSSEAYRLHPIDDLPEPHSVYARSKFWKFYVQLHNLQQGLKHNDYDYVMQILNSVKKEQQSFFTRGCYGILCKEIKYSHYRLSKLVSHSVRIGTTKVSLEILADVAIYVLDHLAEESLWVLAHLLLKDMYSIFKARIALYKLDASTIMLFAEIFIANDEPLNAFSLLKRTKIFYSDPSKWKVQSTPKDNTIRILIITILFSALYKTHPEYAFSLFQFLVVDQGSNFHPIDLLNVANKIVPRLLLKKDPESIVTFAELIIRYNFRLRCIAYRALITSLTQFDIALAKKLYRIATALGVYPMLQIQQATYLVVHSDWTRMEIYLIILHLMEQLSSNIGHAVDHISPKDCTIYFIFENTSTKRFVCNRMVNRQHDKQIESSVTLCKRVLQDKFDPPILTTKQLSERILMLDSVSVLKYLKHKLSA